MIFWRGLPEIHAKLSSYVQFSPQETETLCAIAKEEITREMGLPNEMKIPPPEDSSHCRTS